MKICLFHPVALPAAAYGGVERVVIWLAQGLRDRGHEVWIAAREGSRLPPGIGLLPVPPGEHSALKLAPRLPAGVDVVHFMAPPETGAAQMLPCASLLTVHGNGQPGEKFGPNTVFLSADHARRHGGSYYIHNGVDPREVSFNPRPRPPGSRPLFLSKTSWRVKNLRGAVRICAQSGVGLTIAGGARPWSLRARALWDRRFRWEGAVGGERKAELLANARALVFPVLWDEPFGLVVIESLLAGTPVFASHRGSLPELLNDSVGRLLPCPDSPAAEREWVESLRASWEDWPAWSPEACRDWAQERFSVEKMSAAYEGAYRRVAGGEKLQKEFEE